MKGGVVNANVVGDLPRNHRQVYNIKNNESDALLSIMIMCKEGMAKEDDSFVRIVTSAPEPMCVLSTNYQLDDIERYCIDPEAFSLLCVDPTFNLGDFSLTVTSYSNLLLMNQRTGKHPTMIGPMLIHRRKLFSSYHFFASSLVSLRPSLCHLQAFGTDGEENLYKAFASQFSEACHIRCFLHFRDNCKSKLQDMKVANDSIQEIIHDIFGSLVKGRKGLVDADSAENVKERLVQLRDRWEFIASGFYDWFCEYKVSEMVESMLAPI